MDNNEIDRADDELLLPEDISKRARKAIIIYIFAFLFIFLLFSLLFQFAEGGGKGDGQGQGQGNGNGNGAGRGLGIGRSGEGDGESGRDQRGNTAGLDALPEKRSNSEPLQKENRESSPNSKFKPEKKIEKVANSYEKTTFSPSETFSPFKVKITRKSPTTVKAEIQQSTVSKGDAGGSDGGGSGKIPGTGDISFRIYWTPKMHDVDLHVIDPNGHELFFQNRFCKCQGELDVDDTNNGGPENIFWPTGKAPRGKYKFFVVYYNGYGAENVKIEVRKSGKVFKTYSVTLTQSGDKSEIYSVSF